MHVSEFITVIITRTAYEMQAERQCLIANDVTDEFIRERDEQMGHLERSMQDVNDIYRDLSVMVYTQGDMLDNIEMNISTGANSVAAGTRELNKANTYQRKARNKGCCLLVLLLVILAILALILGLTLS